MTTASDIIAPALRAWINANGKPCEYTPHEASSFVSILIFMRSPTTEELQGAAIQSDIIGVVDAAAFQAALPAHLHPEKFDQVKTLGPIGKSYTVEAWFPRPAMGGDPVAYKIVMRGGEQ